jgi:hypothetical protein
MTHRKPRARSVILLFVDGVGVGVRDRAVNPFATLGSTRLGRFEDEIRSDTLGAPIPIPDDGFWRPIDARLGVPGLPQSATGQATILTGVNAARRAGRHVSAIPDRRVRELLEEDNLFGMLVRAGKRATFANAYTPAYFARKRPHISATTRALMAAGIPLRRIEDLRDGRAVFHDYTNEALRKAGPPNESEHSPLPLRSGADAADVLFGLAREYDFVMHEHFLTDLAGHRGSEDDRNAAVRRIESLVDGLALGAGLTRPWCSSFRIMEIWRIGRRVRIP